MTLLDAWKTSMIIVVYEQAGLAVDDVAGEEEAFLRSSLLLLLLLAGHSAFLAALTAGVVL